VQTLRYRIVALTIGRVRVTAFGYMPTNEASGSPSVSFSRWSPPMPTSVWAGQFDMLVLIPYVGVHYLRSVPLLAAARMSAEITTVRVISHTVLLGVSSRGRLAKIYFEGIAIPIPPDAWWKPPRKTGSLRQLPRELGLLYTT